MRYLYLFLILVNVCTYSRAQMAEIRKGRLFIRIPANMPGFKEELVAIPTKFEVNSAVFDATNHKVYFIENDDFKAYDMYTRQQAILIRGCSGRVQTSPCESFMHDLFFCLKTKRIYIHTEGGGTYDKITYWTPGQSGLVFLCNGSIRKIRDDGKLVVNVTFIDNGKGRCWQDWLIDTNGKRVQSLGNKTY